MNHVAKIFLAGIFTLTVSYVSDRLSEPPPSVASQEYQKYYDSMADRGLSPEEFEKLKKREQEYLGELTNSENLQADIKHIISRKAVIVPIAFILWFFLGFKFGAKNKNCLFITATAITLLSFIFVNIIEALFYAAVFSIGNAFFLKRFNSDRENRDHDNAE